MTDKPPDTARIRRVRLRISGRVQGVAFRAYTCDEGRRLALRGTVRNLPDGRVEVLAEGPADALAELEAFCGRGPPAAMVRDVEFHEEEIRGVALPPFRISY
jgi:acylphosphatase